MSARRWVRRILDAEWSAEGRETANGITFMLFVMDVCLALVALASNLGGL